MRRKKQKNKNGNTKTGPKRIFSRDILRQTEWLSKLGATNQELADFFEVSLKTVEYWLRHHENFKRARTRGKEIADMHVVEKLYQRCIGYDFKEQHLVPTKKGHKTVSIIKHCPPDVKAIAYWLSRRQRQYWGNPNTNVNHTGTVTHMHRQIQDIPVEQLEPETQEFLFDIAKNQLLLEPTSNGTRDN